MVCTKLHCLVDILNGCNAGLENDDSFVNHGDEDLVDDKAGSLVDLNGILADFLGQVVDVIESLFGKGYFDEILGQMDSRPKKPHPDGVYYLAEKLGVTTDEIVYVGDTYTDMITGKESGAWTVGVLWGFRDRAELEKYKADAIIDKPIDILSQVL